MKRKVRILCACGAAIAQSTMMQVRLDEEFEKRGIGVEIRKCVISEVESQAENFHPDFVFTAGAFNKNVRGARLFNGFPIITGMGYDQMVEDLFKAVSELKDN